MEQNYHIKMLLITGNKQLSHVAKAGMATSNTWLSHITTVITLIHLMVKEDHS